MSFFFKGSGSKVKTSISDKLSGYLKDKLAEGTSITLEEITVLGKKYIQISASGTGTDGATWYTASEVPSDILGKNNDLYLNTANYDIYKKEIGSWSKKGNIKGADGTNGTNGIDGVDGVDGTDGATWSTGESAPTGGNDGDFYLKTDGKIYQKQSDTWVLIMTISSSGGTWGSITGTLSNQTDLANALSGKVDKVENKGLSTNDYTTDEKNKLSGIATGATANDTDANLKNRANHTGTQSADTITDGTTNKAYTATEQAKLAGISGINTGDETQETILNKIGYTPEDVSKKGAANGYVPLGSNTKIDSQYLPSYVDDVIEVANYASLPTTGEQGKIYITLDDNNEYRWSGTVYVSLINPLSYATQNEAETGTENTKVMTALRVLQSFVYNLNNYAFSGLTTTTKTITGAINELVTSLGNKVDKVSGKGLSTEDYTSTEKTKLGNISGTNTGNETVDSIGTLLNGATTKATLVNNDLILVGDSADTYKVKKTTWVNFKTIITSYIMGSDSTVSGLFTFIKDKIALAGTSTGKTTLSTANTSTSNYTQTFPAKTGTVANIDDNITGTSQGCDLAAGKQIAYTVPTVDGTATGNVTSTFNCGYSTSAVTDLVYLDSNGKWQKANKATSATTYSGMLSIVLEAGKTDGQAMKVALPGSFIYSTSWSGFTIGGKLYMGASGAITQTATTTNNEAVRCIGYAVAANKIWFNPSPDYVVYQA